MNPRPLVAALVLCLFLLSPFAAHAQSIAITSPTSGQRLAAGPDFPTDVIGDPWDMSNREDLPRMSFGFSGLDIDASGRLLGRPTGTGADFYLLHRGIYGAVNPGRNGLNFPIDTNRYSKIAFKLYSEVAGEVPHVLWHFVKHDGPTGERFGGRYATGASVVGSKIFVVDMAGGNELGMPGYDWRSAPMVIGLNLSPNTWPASVGKVMGVDWVRVIPGDGSSLSVTQIITWIGPSSGTYTLTVDDLGPNPAVPFTIGAIAASSSGSHTFAWKYGFLPPGSYRLSIARSGSATASTTFTINDPPIINITDPDETGGSDFATADMGNTWDMNDAADIQFMDKVAAPNFSGGEFNGVNLAGNNDPEVWMLRNSSVTVDPSRYHRLTYKYRLDGAFDLSAAGGSVVRVFWGSTAWRPDLIAISEDILVWPGDNTYSIDLSTLQVGLDRGIESISAAQELWVSGAKRYFRIDPHEGTNQRPFHYDYVKLAADDETSGGQFTVRWRVSDADSSPLVSLFYDTDTDPASGLTAIPGASNLSAGAGGIGSFVWDTSGVPVGTYYVYATVSDGLNSQGRYSTGPLRVLSAGPSSQTLTVTVSGAGSVTSSPAGINCSPECSRAYIPPTEVRLVPMPSPGNAFSGWSGDPDCLDGVVTMTAARLCTASFVSIVGTLPLTQALDLNGDGAGDSFRYHPATGEAMFDFTNRLGAFGSAAAGSWGSGWTVQPADFDGVRLSDFGNRLTDFFLYNPSTGAWRKAVNNGAGGFTYFSSTWSPGWQVFIVDFNGDGRSDVFLYNFANGQWFRCTTVGEGDFAYVAGSWSPHWRIHPVDLDGNGRTDLFLYDAGTGQWFQAIDNGSGGFNYVAGSWSPGWEIIPGDYNGDGRSDLFLYSPTSGQLSVVTNTGNGGFAYSGGAWSPGWTVYGGGDFDGNGLTDLFIYLRASGQWYVVLSNGAGGFSSYVGGRWDPNWEVHVSDLNGDRRSDLILYSPASGVYVQAVTAAPGVFSYFSGNWGTGWRVISPASAMTPP
ncbi:MAG: VCBS repeat-containing protein [Acidobacteria bacterium]|nr:VCBS repeat-containing protein [Acidobacteriota bacterium]